MVWWQILLFWFSGYCLGILYGRNNPVDDQFTNKIAEMQDRINLAEDKLEEMKILWLNAEQKAITWERRYTSLLPEEKEI